MKIIFLNIDKCRIFVVSKSRSDLHDTNFVMCGDANIQIPLCVLEQQSKIDGTGVATTVSMIWDPNIYMESTVNI
ncbi:UNVERIFIED_CONTAM: hypothetical protein NCL1_32342 [Trichonephila clavipes]